MGGQGTRIRVNVIVYPFVKKKKKSPIHKQINMLIKGQTKIFLFTDFLQWALWFP